MPTENVTSVLTDDAIALAKALVSAYASGSGSATLNAPTESVEIGGKKLTVNATVNISVTAQ